MAPPTQPPVTARGTIRPDLTALAPFPALDAALKRERETPIGYRQVSARDCECLAAQAAEMANLLDRKAASCMPCDQRPHCGRSSTSQASLQAMILHDLALEERNRAAGSALERFFQLSEAEAKYDVFKHNLATIDETLESGDRMARGGFPLGENFSTLRRSRASMLAKNVELQSAIERLNIALKHQLKLAPPNENWRIWPEASWSVAEEPLNADAAVALGMERRPELIMLRTVAQSLNRDTAPVILKVLGQANGPLGEECAGASSKWKVLMLLLGHSRPREAEVEALCRQLQSYRLAREQAVADEIRSAVVDVGSRLRLVAVAREDVRGWERRLDELAAKKARGLQTFPDDDTAQMHKLEAESDLVGRVMDWNIARVKLAQAQGILADGCVGP